MTLRHYVRQTAPYFVLLLVQQALLTPVVEPQAALVRLSETAIRYLAILSDARICYLANISRLQAGIIIGLRTLNYALVHGKDLTVLLLQKAAFLALETHNLPLLCVEAVLLLVYAPGHFLLAIIQLKFSQTYAVIVQALQLAASVRQPLSAAMVFEMLLFYVSLVNLVYNRHANMQIALLSSNLQMTTVEYWLLNDGASGLDTLCRVLSQIVFFMRVYRPMAQQ